MIRETGVHNQIEESYDYLIASSGLRRNWPTVPRSLSKFEYNAEASKHVDKAQNSRNGVVVIGGGMPPISPFFVY